MNIGIVTTWFERGAAYVSKQYMKVLQEEHNVFIYVRSGESYAKGDPEWDLPNVYWSKKIDSPFTVTVMDKKEFTHWIDANQIEAILFNEQHWWEPLIWCEELNVKTIAYIDYYTENTMPLFAMYDLLICNTQKHLEAFKWHDGARYIPWGTNIDLFVPDENRPVSPNVVFFHSCGMNPKRKGTDLLLKAMYLVKNQEYKVIIHSQTNLRAFYPDLIDTIDLLIQGKKLEIVNQTINAPGLYTMGDIYVYPSRLEGIGLTVAEAISCGLGVIVPDCGPMNEFVNAEFGRKVKVEKYFSRYDGYYWPQNEVSISALANTMEYYANNDNLIPNIKLKAREYAVENLDWYLNAKILNQYITDLFSKKRSAEKKNVIEKIKQFENQGLRRYNKYYLRFPFMFKLLNSVKG